MLVGPGTGWEDTVAAQATFGGLLRQLRTEAGLTQEELAEAAGLSPRSVSDLERGINQTARKDTARLLADALGLADAVRYDFEAVARGRTPAGRTVAGGGLAAATRTLPRDIASFTGRGTELAELVGAVGNGVVGIHAIGGMAGIGKTTFAVHAAHQLAPRFPDGQIFLPLHGHTPGQQPVDPSDALASLLLTAGIAAARIPPGVEARMALWRDHLAGKQLLLVLDDATSSEQVRPLLPGTATSLVLVTSRRRLTALDDAVAVSLDALPPGEAAGLLVRLAGRPGLDPADLAVAEIIELCGCLPLAVGMLARQLHHHPAWTPADLATDLAAARDRLELMETENVSVAAAFDLSYQDLTPGAQRLFRRLGLHLGSDIDARAAAALDGADPPVARRHLAALYDHYLIGEPARGRYRLHDLIREHARALAAADPPADTAAAVDRLLDYYLQAARAADKQLPRRVPAVPSAGPAVAAAPVPGPATEAEAFAWLETERLNLHAAARYAADRDRSHAFAIPAALHGFLRTRGYWGQALGLHLGALDVARRAGDRLAEAGALQNLGDIQRVTGERAAAEASLGRALELYREQGHRLGEAVALDELASLQHVSGHYAAAAAGAAQALELYRSQGDQLGEASALSDLGLVQYLTDDLTSAKASLNRALELYRGIGNRLGEANSLKDLGGVHRAAGEYPAAASVLARSLELQQSLGNRMGEANTLIGLAAVQRATGDYAAAAASCNRALELQRALGNRSGQADALNQLGALRYDTGDYEAAIASHRQVLELCGASTEWLCVANAYNLLGAAYLATGDLQESGRHGERALELYRKFGDREGEAEVLNNLAELSLASATLAGARARHEQALAIAIEAASPVEQARALEGIGRCHLRQEQPGPAASRLREALAIYQRIGSPRTHDVETTLRDHGL
jgi:tetratricopeptide (TPR) repeat protein/transcriptional regulator with XRE-family HTH domain